MRLKLSARDGGKISVVAERVVNGRRQVLVKRSMIEDITYENVVAMVKKDGPQLAEDGKKL